jgi:glycosyltransferase involved in cell wall biosynthesis
MPTVTILEAMSLGKALITTAVGGAFEVFTEGGNALLVRPEAPDALAAAIRRLIDDPTLVGELGDSARRTYKENFTMDRFGPEFSALIKEAISPAAAGVAAESTT